LAVRLAGRQAATPGLSVTDRFNRLVDRAGARRIRLHDVGHTYPTLSLDTGIEPKILSHRVGHSNPAVTFQITHRSTGQDPATAKLVGRLTERAVSAPEDRAPETC
jgi:integrase